MAATFTRENFNAREEILSSDLNRLQRLQSREVQDLMLNEARAIEGSVLATPSGYTDVSVLGVPINGADLVPSLAAGTGFTVNISFGSCFHYNPGSVGDDDSRYEVCRWPTQTLTIADPDNTNPRIDVIVAFPGEVTADPSSRNILVDPIQRTIAAQTVDKTANPLASLVVATGVPGASPVPPTVPVGAVALFEVYVPANAVDASEFLPCRRINKRVSAPMSSMHGVLSGMNLLWGNNVDESTSANVFIDSGNKQVNRVVIDGELLWFGPSALFPAKLDTLANPEGSSAPATNDRPYYIYACGGRNMPQMSPGSVGSFPSAPVVLVLSLIPPLASGYPSAVIGTPRGNTQRGALYVGIGFTIKGTTRRKSCAVQGDWVRARTGTLITEGGLPIGFADDLAVAAPPASQAVHALTLASKPPISTRAVVGVLYKNSHTPEGSRLWVGSSHYVVGLSDTMNVDMTITRPGEADQDYTFKEVEMDVSSGTVLYLPDILVATATVKVFAKAYNMLVPRIAE